MHCSALALKAKSLEFSAPWQTEKFIAAALERAETDSNSGEPLDWGSSDSLRRDHSGWHSIRLRYYRKCWCPPRHCRWVDPAGQARLLQDWRFPAARPWPDPPPDSR